ncbi:MAG: CRISPR-associated endonuclease Cas2 [Methanothrix sp.]|nr:CRISPR-associated endonuclease Cas2 [Methanothrix sp.]MDD4447646.1 CRISPR-associated endonuclease Cas2 [Methanothrix sp.]
MIISEIFCYLVSYDIMDEKRLQRVHKAMMGFGEPLHYSVFRCDLTLKGRVQMVQTILELIEDNKDRVMIVDMGPVDGRVEERIEFLGNNRQNYISRRDAIIV